MIKRIAGMAAVSAVLCCVVAAQASRPVPDANGSGEAVQQLTLQPAAEEVTYEQPQEITSAAAAGVSDVLKPSAEYGAIVPYPAAIVGWKADGTAVYRYAVADAQGEQLTSAGYTAAKRVLCGKQTVWMLTGTAADGSAQTTCAAADGSWVLGPFSESITVMEDAICRQMPDSTTVIYSGSGTLRGTVKGAVSSCTDGVLVSYAVSTEGTVWYLYDADDLTELSEVKANQIGAFSGGYATIQVSEGQWGAVDTSGIITLYNRVTWADEMCNGYALAQDENGKYGVVSASGETSIEFSYIKGKRCSEKEALYQLWTSETECVVMNTSWKNKKMALPKDLDGQELKALPDNYFSYTNEDGCSVIFDDLKSVSLEGEAAFYPQDDMLICATQDGYQIFDPDPDNETASELYPYTYLAPTEDAAEQDTDFSIVDPETGLQGIANTDGKLVLQPVYDSISSTGSGYYIAVQDGWSGVVDKNGTWLVHVRLSGVQ